MAEMLLPVRQRGPQPAIHLYQILERPLPAPFCHPGSLALLRRVAIARGSLGRGIPVEVRTDVGAAVAAGLAHKARLKIGQPHIVGRAIGCESSDDHERNA